MQHHSFHSTYFKQIYSNRQQTITSWYRMYFISIWIKIGKRKFVIKYTNFLEDFSFVYNVINVQATNCFNQDFESFQNMNLLKNIQIFLVLNPLIHFWFRFYLTVFTYNYTCTYLRVSTNALLSVGWKLHRPDINM